MKNIFYSVQWLLQSFLVKSDWNKFCFQELALIMSRLSVYHFIEVFSFEQESQNDTGFSDNQLIPYNI